MGTPDYLPRAKAALYVWQDIFYNRVMEKQGSFKIDEAKYKPLTAAKSKYDLSFGRANNVDSANRADRVELKVRTAEYKAEIRKFINENIRFNSNVSEYDRQYLGLTIADTTPTPVTVPLTHPVIEIDFSETRVHILHLKDESKSGKSKPAGVRNAEVFAKVGGEPPVDDSELLLAGTPSDGKLRLTYAAGQVGLRVYYQARWVNTRSQAGEFGSVVSAVIA